MPTTRAMKKSAHAAVAARDYLQELPIELQLRIAAAVSLPRDRAALALALPRLGIEAQRCLPAYQGLVFGVALRLHAGGSITDEFLFCLGLWLRSLVAAAITDAGQRKKL